MPYKTASITEASTYQEVDDALYAFEQPYYAECARGFPGYENRPTPEWKAERERLTALWKAKYAETYPERMPKPGQSSWTKMINFLRTV